jgi:hypothetical protein
MAAATSFLLREGVPMEATEPIEETQAPVMLPVCPYCGDDPAKLAMMFQKFPGGQIGSIIFCGNPSCRKMLPAQVVGMEKSPIMHPGGKR